MHKFISQAKSTQLTDDERDLGRIGMSHLFAIQPGTTKKKIGIAWPWLMLTFVALAALVMVLLFQ